MFYTIVRGQNKLDWILSSFCFRSIKFSCLLLRNIFHAHLRSVQYYLKATTLCLIVVRQRSFCLRRDVFFQYYSSLAYIMIYLHIMQIDQKHTTPVQYRTIPLFNFRQQQLARALSIKTVHKTKLIMKS